MKLCASWQENCSNQEVKRNPKSEARNSKQARRLKISMFQTRPFEFRILGLEFVSDLDIGISDFQSFPFWFRLGRVRRRVIEKFLPRFYSLGNTIHISLNTVEGLPLRALSSIFTHDSFIIFEPDPAPGIANMEAFSINRGIDSIAGRPENG